MELKEHINKAYNGNVSAFAEAEGYHRQQVYRYLERGAIWQDGRVLVEPTKHKDKS